MATHVHYFRKRGGQWMCADETCLMPVAAIASHAADCTLDHPCPECAADLELLGGYLDPLAVIAASPPPGNPDCQCGGLGTVSCGACWATGEGPWGATCRECDGGEKPCPKCGPR